jgi:ligand-binding sensor domain-containing protein
MWLGTYENGVAKYDTRNNTWTVYTEIHALSSSDIKAILTTKDTVWVATTSGLNQLDLSLNEAKDQITTPPAYWHTITKADGLVDNYITCVLEENERLWVGTPRGLGKWNIPPRYSGAVHEVIAERSEQASTVREKGNTSSALEDAHGKWTFYTIKDGLADDFVTSLAYGDGLLWIGTKAGLSTYNPTTHQWNTHSSKIRVYSRVIAIATDNIEHIVWIATGVETPAYADGLVKYDTSLGEVVILKEDNGLPCNYINTVVVGKDSVWVGTRAGLAHIRYHGSNGQTQTIRVHHPISPHPPSEVQPLIEPLSVFTVADGLPDNNVRAIAIDDDLPEIIWIGTPAGLAKYDSEADKWVTYTRENTDGGLQSNNITSISIKGSRLWVGTIAGVSCLYKKGNSLSLSPSRSLSPDEVGTNDSRVNFAEEWIKYNSVATTEILRENNVSKLQADGDYIWFGNWSDSTSGAIGRFDRQTRTFKFFSKNDLPLKPTENPITTLRWIAVDENVENRGEYNDVWFGTNGGLLRYSKTTDSWSHYTNADGLANNNIYQVVADGRYIWISHAGGIVSRYDVEKNEWKSYEICKSVMWSNVGSIAAGKRYVWFTTTWSGVKRYDKQTDTWTTFAEPQGLGADETNQVLIDGDYVWVSAWGDTSRYDTRTDTWKIVDSRRVLSGVTMWMDKGQDGVWFMYSGGDRVATKYHHPTDSWITLNIHGSEEDEWEWGQPNQAVETDEDVWFATGGRGLFRYNKASKGWTIFNEKNGLASNRINDRSLLVDDDYIWVGTNRGLCRYDKRAETWINFTQSLSAQEFSERKVYAIAIDGRYVWVGAGNGLYRYDKQTDRWSAYRDKRQSVTSMAIDEKYVWVGTTNGLNRLNKAANNFQEYKDKNGLPSNRVLDVALFGLDLWVATDAGVGLYNRNSDDPNAWETYTHTLDIQTTQESKEYSASLASNDVRCIAADEKFVWCGTELGVSRYDKSRRTWTNYTSEDGILVSPLHRRGQGVGLDIGAIAIDGDDIWFGADMGATKYNLKSHDFVTYTKTDGLASDVVTFIAVNDEMVWFGSSDAGATRYDKATKRWRVFTKSDGLLHNRVYAIAFDGDYVWFGTENGLSRYDEKTGTWTAYADTFGWQ